MKNYCIDGKRLSEKDFCEELESVVRDLVENSYDERLDELYEPVQIGCCEFSASQVLYKCDPIAYNLGLSDFVDDLLTDAWYDLDRGREVEIDGYIFEIIEEDDEEEEEDEEE